MNHLNSDLLRTFLAVAETGSVSKGADRIHRSQSAASIQIKQLEDLLGKPVFTRHGRGVVLNETGDRLAPVARQIVQSLDGVMADIAGTGLQGTLRIGIPDDHSREALSKIIADFTREHPKVDLTVRCGPSTDFSAALGTGDLDMAVHEVDRIGPGMDLLRVETLHWVAARSHAVLDRTPVPVAVFDRACWWRTAALDALCADGRAYRVVYSSESVTGVAAAISAGIAIGVLSRSALSPDLTILSGEDGFGDLPVSYLVLERTANAEHQIGNVMAMAIRRAFGSGAS